MVIHWEQLWSTWTTYQTKVKKLIKKEIVELNIPTAIPLVYEFDEDLKVLRHSYLADPEELEAQINKVKKQTAAKWGKVIPSDKWIWFVLDK